jgi:hypothetical protein
VWLHLDNGLIHRPIRSSGNALDWEMLGSNLGRDTGYTEIPRGSLQSLRANPATPREPSSLLLLVRRSTRHLTLRSLDNDVVKQPTTKNELGSDEGSIVLRSGRFFPVERKSDTHWAPQPVLPWRWREEVQGLFLRYPTFQLNFNKHTFAKSPPWARTYAEMNAVKVYSPIQYGYTVRSPDEETAF